MEKNSVKVSQAGQSRFKMVKERHAKTAQKAMKEGKADKALGPLLKHFIKSKEFFTSSSCAGRILLLGVPKDGNKRDAFFHRKWHRKVSFKEVMQALEEKTAGSIWFKQEPFILHIGAGSLDNSNKVLTVMRKAGIKRYGIIVAKKGKFIAELTGNQGMSVPVKEEEKLLVGETFLKYLVKEANKKIEKNYSQLKRLEVEIKKELK